MFQFLKAFFKVKFTLTSGSFHLEVFKVELDLVAAGGHDLPHAVQAVRVAARIVRRRQLSFRNRVRQLQPPSAYHGNLPERKTGKNNVCRALHCDPCL